MFVEYLKKVLSDICVHKKKVEGWFFATNTCSALVVVHCSGFLIIIVYSSVPSVVMRRLQRGLSLVVL